MLYPSVEDNKGGAGPGGGKRGVGKTWRGLDSGLHYDWDNSGYCVAVIVNTGDTWATPALGTGPGWTSGRQPQTFPKMGSFLIIAITFVSSDELKKEDETTLGDFTDLSGC